MKKTVLTLLLTSFFTIHAANAACENECPTPAKPAKKAVKKTAKTHKPSGVVVNGIRYVSYDKDKTYTIPTAPGIVSEIIFEDGESVEYHRFGFGNLGIAKLPLAAIFWYSKVKSYNLKPISWCIPTSEIM